MSTATGNRTDPMHKPDVADEEDGSTVGDASSNPSEMQIAEGTGAKKKKKKRRRKKKKKKPADASEVLVSSIATALDVSESNVHVTKGPDGVPVQVQIEHPVGEEGVLARRPDIGSINIDKLPNAQQIRHLLPLSQIVQEARDLCSSVAKLRFKADDLQFRLDKIMDCVRRDAYSDPPLVNIGVVTNLWQLLQTANARVAERHASLTNSLRIQQLNAHRAKNLDRQRVQLRKIESLNRTIKDCRADATVFNCIVSLFSKTSIYAQLQNLKDTQYVKNSKGEIVQKLQPDEVLPSFDEVLSEEKFRRGGTQKKGRKLDQAEDVFGSGSLLSMLHENSEDDEDPSINDAIRRNREW